MREGQPSKTALGVARGLVFAAADPTLGPLCPPRAGDYAEKILGAQSRTQAIELKLLSQTWYRALGRVHERIWVRGGFLHLALRKRFIDDSVRAALADGAEQLVVIGGGLDTLALRIAEDEPSRHVFELDHPDSQAAKRRGLDALPPRPANFHLEGVDLAQHALPDVLARIQAFEAAKPTVFVAEGLLMYLDHDDVKRLLDGIANTAPAHSRIVFTFLSADELGRPVIGHAAARTRFLLKLYGEPLRSGIHPERLGEYLRERGFALREHWDERRLLARYLPERDAARTPLLDWEYAAIADRGSV
ncbi:MAG: SAM-dependent methyltransferase [Planctomycetes bacterium]|nr:SAM-dependent methyltransferase [Planctomycetota bacterium]